MTFEPLVLAASPMSAEATVGSHIGNEATNPANVCCKREIGRRSHRNLLCAFYFFIQKVLLFFCCVINTRTE